MGDASFVAGDWGTSHLRLFLCDSGGTVLDSCSGPGAADAGGRFAEIFTSLTASWADVHGALPAVLCGMVGSNIGWMPAPYVACPAWPDQISDGCVTPAQGVHIVPGLTCRNRFNAPDVLRGEETQILGALHLLPTLRGGCRLLCLPGTHTKWVVLQDGRVSEFLTAPTGEVFALLRHHSVLGGKHGRAEAAADAAADAQGFQQGLAHFNEFPQAQLLHRLFECRGRQLRGDLAAAAAAAYLSGLLIASDVHGALAVLSSAIEVRTVYLIGTSELTGLYAAALACHGHEAAQIDGAAAARGGLTRVHQHLSRRVTAHGH
jgi:2-dehydro-3-deoxygalactonokinase